MMGRPRTFDMDAALDAATTLFWERGYDGAGLTDLLDAMGIMRGSLYKAWGSKKGLFLACLDRYEALHVTPGIAFLNGEGGGAGLSAAERIDAVFTAHDPRGCLLCNTAAGVAGTDAEIATRVRDQLDALRDAFGAALRDAGGDRPGIAAEADRLTQRYVGMRVRQRADQKVSVQ